MSALWDSIIPVSSSSHSSITSSNRGIIKCIVVPLPARLSTKISPPCLAIILYDRLIPNPDLFTPLVEKNGSNILSLISSFIPIPLSEIAMLTLFSSVFIETSILPPIGIASILLLIMFMTTSRNSEGLHLIRYFEDEKLFLIISYSIPFD